MPSKIYYPHRDISIKILNLYIRHIFTCTKDNQNILEKALLQIFWNNGRLLHFLNFFWLVINRYFWCVLSFHGQLCNYFIILVYSCTTPELLWICYLIHFFEKIYVLCQYNVCQFFLKIIRIKLKTDLVNSTFTDTTSVFGETCVYWTFLCSQVGIYFSEVSLYLRWFGNRRNKVK